MSKLFELSGVFTRALFNSTPQEFTEDGGPAPNRQSDIAPNEPSVDGLLKYERDARDELDSHSSIGWEYMRESKEQTIANLKKAGATNQQIKDHFATQTIRQYLRTLQKSPSDVSAASAAVIKAQEAELNGQTEALKREIKVRKERMETEAVSGLKAIESYAAELRALGGIEIGTDLGVADGFLKDSRVNVYERLDTAMPLQVFVCMTEIGKNKKGFGVSSGDGKHYSLILNSDNRDAPFMHGSSIKTLEQAIKAMSMVAGMEYPERAEEIDIVTRQFLSQAREPNTTVDKQFVDSLQIVKTDGSNNRQPAAHISRESPAVTARSRQQMRPIG